MTQEIYEAALEEDNLNKCRGHIHTKFAYGSTEPEESRLLAPLFEIGRVWALMDGAIDTHVHSGPDAYNTRLYDEMEMAIQACQAHMKAVVFKCHSTPSARSAAIVQPMVNKWADEHGLPRVDVFGGVVLNYSVGGLNPEAVSVSYRVGGKVVWLPNMDASFHRKVFGQEGGIEVLDENDRLVPELMEILAMVKEGDMMLSICHQSTKERFAIVDGAHRMGIERVEIIHPTQMVSKMTVEQMKTAADKGAYISFYCVDFAPDQWSWEVFLEAIKVVGPDRLVAGTDAGHFALPMPADAMRRFITEMLLHGVSEADIEKMVKRNPSNLLY